MKAAVVFLCLSSLIAIWNFMPKRRTPPSQTSEVKNGQENLQKPPESKPPVNPVPEKTVVEAPKEEKKEYEKWGIYTVEKDRSLLLPEKKKSFLVPTNLQDLKVTSNNEGIRISGKYDFSPDSPEVLRMGVAIWDVGRSEKALERSFDFQGEFSFEVSNFSRPMAPGFYYVQLFLSPSLQTPDGQNLFLPNVVYEWWATFEFGSIEEIQKWSKRRIEGIEKTLGLLGKLHERLDSMRRSPMENLKRQWSGWCKKWMAQYEKIAHDMEEEKQRYLFFADRKLENELAGAAGELRRIYEETDHWIQGLSLFPPADMEGESFKKRLNRLTDFVLEEKKRFAQIMDSQKKKK